jgi:hypothetical protein
MLGHAELRLIDETLAEERSEPARTEQRSPYIMPHFAVGLAMTRAVTGEMKQHFSLFQTKR